MPSTTDFEDESLEALIGNVEVEEEDEAGDEENDDDDEGE